MQALRMQIPLLSTHKLHTSSMTSCLLQQAPSSYRWSIGPWHTRHAIKLLTWRADAHASLMHAPPHRRLGGSRCGTMTTPSRTSAWARP